jgi:dTDP-4-dehydrorhamnose reductase
MRVAITGAGGGLGRALLRRLDGDEVRAFSHGELAVEDPATVDAAIASAEPETVLHLGAMTSVDACELDPDRAFLVNALGTRNVADATRRAGALMVLLSTDYVFDGAKGEPYHEFDEPRPPSVYGASKLQAEREARALCPDHLIVRTSWVFGAGDDFVTRSVRRLAAGEEVGGIVDQVGTPTHVDHLAERLLEVVRLPARGVVHLAGPEPATWHDVLTRARDLGRLPGSVTEQKMGDLDRPAPRPVNSALTSLVLPGYGVAPLPRLNEAIREVVSRAHG